MKHKSISLLPLCFSAFLITLPLFFIPFEPCITMCILELVPAPRMFPVTIWTLYTIPGEYGYMLLYQRPDGH